MNFKRISTGDFNYYLQRAKYDTVAAEFFYPYCTEIIKNYVINKYGRNNFYDNIPHDVFTRILFDSPPNTYVKYPISYLCRSTSNYMYDVYKLKDNQTLELLDNYAYIPEYDEGIEFTDENVEKAWNKLDEKSRYLLYLTDILDYRLEEVAEMLNKSYESIKSKKWRAKSEFKKYIVEFKRNSKEKV